MGVFVKICGCASKSDLDAVVACEPDAVGFILWPRSKRYVEPVVLKEWLRDLPAVITKVGVFVDASHDEVMRAMETGLDVAQLHGAESPVYCDNIGGRAWKAIHLNKPNVYRIEDYRVEAFLLDYHGDTQPGGTGQRVDTEPARAFVVANAARRVLLAGGLTPVNVVEAIRAVRPWGVDVSSGVESSPGVKDMEKVKEFIRQCRSVN